jgi:hypothetical protein
MLLKHHDFASEISPFLLLNVFRRECGLPSDVDPEQNAEFTWCLACHLNATLYAYCLFP